MGARTLVATAIAILLFSLTACATRERQSVEYAPAETYGAEQELEPQAQQREPAPLWPRIFTSGDVSFVTYEPTIKSWKDDKLEARVAVEVYPAGAGPKYGFVWFECPTQTDRARGVVTLGDVRITRANFPTARDRVAAYVEALSGADLAEAKTVAIDRLEREVEYGAAERPVPARAVSTDPPTMIVRDRPTTLVQVDGAPRLRDEGGVERVINTRALILSDRGAYYVWVGDRWFRATSIDSEYTEARDVPPAIEAAKARLATTREIDLFTDATERMRDGMKVVVATKPAELIETGGAPTYEPIAGTALSWLSNTDADVLRHDAAGQTYVLLRGRWFRAASLSGPWTFVAGRDLPGTFRDIPRDHREARVLASIPDTPEAEEASIAASIPQTAVVDRAHAQLAVAYDGQPDFRPVEGASAPIRYAVNSTTPVIAASDGMYYAVEDGVWFVSPSPTGPWTVATSVPDVIYSIPQSSPIHYVTYVRVYGYSPEYAYVGYTPGYLGVYYTGGIIALGVGFGPWWYGPPGYYGYYRYHARPRWVGHGWAYPSYPRPGWRGPTYVGGGNVYRRWAPSVVHAPPAYVARPGVRAPRAMIPASPSVGPRVGPRVTTPAPSYVPRTSAPSYPRAPAPSYVPRAPAPYTPRTSAPSYPRAPAPSYVPRAPAPSYTPRGPAPSYAPRTPYRPPPSSGVLRGSPGGAARVAPPSFAPPARSFPSGGARGGSAPARGGRR